MRALYVWLTISAFLLVCALVIKVQHPEDQGLWIMGTLAACAVGFIVKVCRG